jgi:hypothetical protein
VAAAAAAPEPLRPRIARIRLVPAKGLVADLDDGPLVILGSTADLRAKWTAAAAILADATSRGAAYVDVRLPGRPVAGGVDMPQPAPEEDTIVPPASTAPQPAAPAPATDAQTAAPAESASQPQTATPVPAPTAGAPTSASPPTGGTPTGTTP